MNLIVWNGASWQSKAFSTDSDSNASSLELDLCEESAL